MNRIVGALIIFLSQTCFAMADGDADWLRIQLRIETSGKVACALTLAHWYEYMTNPAELGKPVHVPLRVRMKTGEVALENTLGDKMLLERVSCGDATQTRRLWHFLPIDKLRHSGNNAVIRCDEASPSTCRWAQ